MARCHAWTAVAAIIALLSLSCASSDETQGGGYGVGDGGGDHHNATSVYMGPVWEEFICDDTSRPYFVNLLTKESFWEIPEGTLVKKWDAERAAFFIWDTRTNLTFWEGEEAVEAEWREGTTTEGYTYWYNTVTGESEWHNPALAASEAMAMMRQEGGRGGESAGGDDGDGWTEAVDGEGNKYFYNAATDQSLWHIPGEEVYTGSTGGGESEWQVAVSEEGRKFYYNTLTGQAQWYHPHDRTDDVVVWGVWATTAAVLAYVVWQFIHRGGDFKPLTAWEKQKMQWKEKRSERRSPRVCALLW
mmetsp:Transcript_47434/g.151937  ORF Transcript_47434/g.151937 Transcript_47434/m.151937 type:complete len:302 (-) Transcript_47434:749-1654(-)